MGFKKIKFSDARASNEWLFFPEQKNDHPTVFLKVINQENQTLNQ